jgi:predicted nucleic acid-binding protein
MIIYVESSAAAPLIKEEQTSASMREALALLEEEGHLLVTSRLTETELRRMGLREGIPQTNVSELLQHFDVVEPSAAQFHHAGVMHPLRLRTLDALHIAVAIGLDAQMMVTLDARVEEACQDAGLPVLDISS